MFAAIRAQLLAKAPPLSISINHRNVQIFVALTFFLLIASYLIISWTLWKARSEHFERFASENACVRPPTITGSFLQGICHKWKRLHQRGDIFNDYMRGIFLAHGPTHAIVRPFTGEVKTIYTIEPENVKTMLSINFSDFHRPRTMPNALNPVMGQGVFTSNGEAWQHSRSMVKSQFSTRRIRNVAKLEPHLLNIFEAIGSAGEDGWTEEQEILPIFNRFTLDAATEFMFGTSAESHEAAMREKFMRIDSAGPNKRSSRDFWARNGLVMGDFGTAFDVALDYVALRLKLGRLWFLADSIRFRVACHTVKRFADNYIRDAAAHAALVNARSKMSTSSASSHPAQVSNTGGFTATSPSCTQIDNQAALLDAEEAHDDRRYGLISELVESYPDKIHLRNQVMQLLVAGRDTTAATLAWTLILIEAHPDVFSRLRSSIVSTFGTESKPLAPVTFSTLRACKYLQWVIFEVVRLYPTGPLNARKASKDTILPVGGGPQGKDPVAVKAGTTVAYNTYLMHRREELWGEDAWCFRPERWENRKIGWEYVPFHGGPQTCLGQQHALTEMAFVITRLLQRFDAIQSSTQRTNFENGIRTILVPKNAVRMRFHSIE